MGQAYEVISQILNILGVLVRFVGVIVFGLAVGWLTLTAFKRETPWYYQAVLLVVFFGFFAAVFWNSNPGVLGGLTLGTGLAILLWGMRKANEKVEPPPAEEPPAVENKRIRKVA
jgi:F0F1-type ATP synthase assembly protein I